MSSESEVARDAAIGSPGGAVAHSLLRDVTVLDLSGAGPGARCARVLADLGAHVVRILPTLGRLGQRPNVPYHAYGASRDWSFVRLDLKAPGAAELIYDVAAEVDVFVEGFRPGVAERLGIGYERLRHSNPRLVYCSISGYGATGPNRERPGHDINYQAVAGVLSTDRDGRAVHPSLTVADSAGGGLHASVSILAALHAVVRDGVGSWLDVSMTDGTMYLNALAVDEYLVNGGDRGVGGGLLSGDYACYGLYETKDGEWLAVGAIESGFFANLCRVLGCEDLIPRQLDPAAQSAIRERFVVTFSEGTRAEWLERFAGVDACVTPMNRIRDVVLDEQFADGGKIVPVEHAERGSFLQVGRLLAGSVREDLVRVGQPDRTAAADVLGALVIAASRIGMLLDTGVVG